MKEEGLSTSFSRICTIVLALLFAVIVVTATQAETINLRVYYHASPSGGQAKFYQAWIKKVEEATGGRVKMTFYPGAVLGPPMEAYTMIKDGAVDMGCVIIGFFPGRFPLTNVIQLPFIGLPSAEVGSRIYWDLYEKFPEFRADYPDVKVLNLYTDAPTPIGTKKPVRTAEDIKGMKIRALAGAPTEMLKELGAAAVLMPPTEIYTSMERGVIDGWMISWEACAGAKYWEVTDYWTTANMYQPALAFLMNLDSWNRLPPDIQKIFDEHAGAAGSRFFGQEFDRYNNEAKETVEKMKGKEIIELSDEQVEKWKKITRPVIDRWLADMKSKGLPGEAVLAETERLLKQYSK